MKKFLLIVMALVIYNPAFTRAEQISNLIMPVSYFVDHVKQLNLLKENLTKYRQASVIGVSGLGKTQVTRMYVHENKDYYEIIWFIDCNLDINEELLKLAKAINAVAKTKLISEEDIFSVKKELLAYLSNKDHWLLVFDNLKINENQKIKEFIDWEHNGHVIFVSQDRDLLTNIVKMSRLERSDAIILAKNLLYNKDPQSVEFLAKAFDGYPILIVQGAQLLNAVAGLNMEEYKKQVNQSEDKIKLNVTLALNELKPSAKQLLNKIALINNQAFSKQLLGIITDSKDTLDGDILELSKFSLISNTDDNKENPIFEMYDIIAEKIAEINGAKNNQIYLEDIIAKFKCSIPSSVVEERIFIDKKTIRENLSIIFKSSERYNVTIYKMMDLGVYSLSSYLNIFDYYNAKKMVDWFNKNEQAGKFTLLLMDNDAKQTYARYLGLIGAYYIHKDANRNKSLEYYLKANQVLEGVKNAETIKNNIFYNLAIGNIHLGNLEEAEKYIHFMEELFEHKLVNESDISFLYFIKARLACFKGQYIEALTQINNCIDVHIKLGVPIDDLFYTQLYLLKAGILNFMGKYQEAYEQAQQLYKMYKPVKQEDHEIFGRIYVQMSRAEFGLGNSNKALDYVQKAKNIFIHDRSRNNENLKASKDTNLVTVFITEGDILSSLGKLEEAISAYQQAETIYNNCLGQNLKIEPVSLLYFKAASTALKSNDDFFYKHYLFKHEQIFGYNHPRTKELYKLALTKNNKD